MSVLHTATVVPEPPAPKGPDPSPLVHGQRLDQATFHDLYEQTSADVKAELIGGVVYVASPVGSVHSEEHARLVTLAGMYAFATRGVSVHDNGTVVLGPDAEPQPDVMLRRVRGGRTRLVHRGETNHVAGPPEWVAEVASSTELIDPNQKRHDYDRYGVGEYLVHVVRTRTVVRSRQLPSLWIDSLALVAGDAPRLKATLDAGLGSAEHTPFVTASNER